MELKLKINSKNTFPKGGIFIKGASAEVWLYEIQNMGLRLSSITAFPVPGVKANELYGCLLVLNKNNSRVASIGKNNFCQLIENKLFIPENTFVEPELTKEEWHSLFSDAYHFLHPEIGLVELKEEVNWTYLLQLPSAKEVEVREPSKTVAIPQYISSLRVEVDQEKILEEIENPISEEEMIAKLPFDMQKLMKGNQKEMDKFLKFLDENPKLALQMAIPLDTLGTARGGNNGQFSFGGSNSIFNSIKGFDLSSSAMQSFGKVLKFGFIIFFVLLIRSCDPQNGAFEFQSLFTGLFGFIVLALIVGLVVSLLSGDNSGSRTSKGVGGNALVDSERFNTLQSKYEKLAQEYAAKKEYKKASHIYLKLLKNHHKAAEVLEKGELYAEAATVYLKYVKNKHKAAECYEKGHAYKEAIAIYKELDNDEKVGDLYLLLKNKKEADKYFYNVIQNYRLNSQFVKASSIYKDKIGDLNDAQEILLMGWKANKDAVNCLNNYFANIKSIDKLSLEIATIYEKEMTQENAGMFLQVLKYEFDRSSKLEELTKNMAYEIAAATIDEKPEIAAELLHFNKENKTMLKDVMKYKLKRKSDF